MRNKKVVSIIFSMIVGMWIFCSFTAEHTHPYPLSTPAYFGKHYFIPKDNPLTVEGVALGRMLFYETALSANQKISCATCHQQSKAFTDGLTKSIGIDKIPFRRNAMAIINLLWTRNFFWDGRASSLETQVEGPLTNPHEMGNTFANAIRQLQRKTIYASYFGSAFGDTAITQSSIEKALAQFERTLISDHSPYDMFLQGKYKPTPSEKRGIALFYGTAENGKSAACAHCHGGAKTYEELYMNNGLDSMYADAGRAEITGQNYDNGRFRVVTLRNIALTGPYMHDGRFKTLAEVIDHYSDHIIYSKQLSPFLRNLNPENSDGQMHLSKQDKKDLLSFLNMLTDSTFVHNTQFSNPFIK